jgi:hypothetical protein
MEGWCQQMEQETKDNQLSEEGKTHESELIYKVFCPDDLI